MAGNLRSPWVWRGPRARLRRRGPPRPHQPRQGDRRLSSQLREAHGDQRRISTGFSTRFSTGRSRLVVRAATPYATDLVNQLGSDDPQRRELAADYLGDLLEGSSFTTDDHETIGAALVRASVAEDNTDTLESLLHAIACSYELSFGTLEPLIAVMPSLDTEQLDYCLMILAATHDPVAEPTLTSYTKHTNDRIRASAREALTELPGRQ